MTRSVTNNTSTHGSSTHGGRDARRVVLLAALAASLLGTLSLATSASAQATVFQAAGRQTFRASGLDLQFDTNWVEAPGYFPLRITARQFVPTRSARSIVIELELAVYRDHNTVVRQRIDVPVPPQSATVCVPMPKWVSSWQNNYKLNVYEDGRKLEKLTGHVAVPSRTSNYGGFNEERPNILVIAPVPADSSVLGAMFPDNNMATGAPLSTSATVNPADLPTEWIDYTCLDLIVISRDELAALVGGQPEAWTAIRRWVFSGGNIVVHTDEAEWSELDEIDDMLAAAPPTFESEGSIDLGWETSTNPKLAQPLDNEVLDDEIDQQAWQLGGRNYPRGGYVTYNESGANDRKRPELSPEKAERRERERTARGHVRSRRAGLGYVVAVSGEELFPGDRPVWRAVLNTLNKVNTFDKLDEDRWLWYKRHGVSMVQENRGFWEFLVPGVGHALVTEFQLLISLFVVLIGPVNYFLLRRRHKLHLIIFTTPASAAIVTIALMTWGLVADGLATRARARSYTYIDQRDGTATCWSRLSYYAGIAPSGGLVFPRDVAVLPIRVGDAESNSIVWTTVWDDAQRLESGWLPSRTPTQFMTVRSRATAAGLGVETKVDGAGGDGIVVTNRLGTRVDRLVVCDADGNLYAITKPLAPGKVRTLSQLGNKETTAVIAELRTSLAEHLPRRPEGFSEDTLGRYQQRNQFLPGVGSDRVSPGSSRLERGYKMLNDGLLASELRLAPRTYIAIVERSPEVVFGSDQVQEEASTHLVSGAW